MKGLIFYLQRFTMTGTPSDDVLLNTLEGNEVLTYGGNDSITNMADNASIYAGDGADTVQNYYWDGGDAVYIDGGAGKDSISNSDNYDVTILGGNDNDTIKNFFGSFISINGGKGNDNIDNQFAINSTVNGDAGNDDIYVYRNRNTSINGGAGNDVIFLDNNSGTLTVKGGAGNDVIYGDTLKSVGIVYQYSRGEGKDTIYGFKSDKDTLKVTSGSYSTQKSGGDLIYSIGNGKVYLKDYFISQVLTNSIDNTLFSGTTDDDLMYNYGTNVTINSGEGNDNIYNDADTVTVDAGAGDDFIEGIAWYSSLNGGAGNDLISMTSGLYKTTIVGGLGNDTIYGDDYDGYNTYQYAAGDGYDTVINANSNDTLQITEGDYITQKSGKDLIVKIKPEGSKNYTGEIKFKNLSSINIEVPPPEALINYNDNTIFSGTADDDLMYNYGTNVTINSGTGNDNIYTAADYITIDAGAGDDKIEGNTTYLWYSSLNGGAGNDVISISSGNVISPTIIGGKGNDLIYGNSVVNNECGTIYQYAKGDGNDTIIGHSIYDTISITGGAYMTTISGSDLIVNITSGANSTVSTGKIIINDGANQDINIAGKPVTVGGGRSSEVSQQEVIKKFMGSLDTTNYSGISAVNQAVKVASGGYFSSAQAVINAMVKDRNNSTRDNFLKTYCGINIEGKSSEDTGAITGKDAGGTTVKTKEFIVPESGNLINFTGNSFTANGLTVQLVNWSDDDSYNYTTTTVSNLSAVQRQIWQSFYTWWAAGGLNLIAESYGSNYGFTSASSATAKTLKFGFISDDPDTLAWTLNYTYDGYLGMAINMDYYSNLSSTNVNGYDTVSEQTYLDRTLAHELTHAVMMANIKNFDYLPTYIVEGMAELTHGIDDDRGADIKALVTNTTRMKKALVSRTDYFDVAGVDSPSYVGGYTFLRYLAKQGSLHYGKTSSANAANVANDKTVSIKSAVATLTSDFSKDTFDLTKYDSTVTKVNASKLTKGITIIGNEFANSVKDGKGNDSIYGNSGNDTLLGGAGNDEIYGDAGNNLLKGEAGNDTLFGAGNDTFTGGTGNDLFVYNVEVSGNAVITDYSSSDSIKISGGKISDTIYIGKDVIFELGESSLTVKNAKNKNIDITVSNGSSASWFIDDDNNFISNDTDIDSITQENYSVTNIETSNFDTFAQDKNILTFTDKK